VDPSEGSVSLLFLDFDGVLSRNQPAYGPTLSGPERLIPAAVGLLSTLVERTGCRVVVSSTWRECGVQVLLAWLRSAGYTGTIDGVTRLSDHSTAYDIERGRGAEILDWRRRHAARAPYVVLDDLALAGPVAKRLVQVTSGQLSEADVERAEGMLTSGRVRVSRQTMRMAA
jgi:hypothetical protein